MKVKITLRMLYLREKTPRYQLGATWVGGVFDCKDHVAAFVQFIPQYYIIFKIDIGAAVSHNKFC